jgi:hypothetical protein
MEETIEVSSDLWLKVGEASLKFDGLFHLHDSVGGDTIIDVAEIPKLIEALRSIQERGKTIEPNRLPSS